VFWKFAWSIRYNAITIEPFSVLDMYHYNLKKSLQQDASQQIEAENNKSGYVKGSSVFGLYGLTSFINHSCKYNAMISTKYLTAKHDVIAARNIKAGEEILISYIGDVSDFNEGKISLVRVY
jgi:SET domain-containing protein